MKFSRVIQTTNVIIIKKIKRKLYANIIESAIYIICAQGDTKKIKFIKCLKIPRDRPLMCVKKKYYWFSFNKFRIN